MKKGLMFVLSVVLVAVFSGVIFASSPIQVHYYPAWINHWENAGVLVAIDQGLYEAVGLKVTDYSGGPALNPIERMLNDRTISFATSYSWLVLMARINQGLENLVVVATDFQKPALFLISWNPINKTQDLFEKKIEVWQGYEYPLLAYLGKDSLKAKIIYQGASMEPFLLKQVDVAHAMVYNELLTVLHRFGFKDLNEYWASNEKPFYVYRFKDLDPDLAWGENSLVTSTTIAYQHPDVVEKFIHATYQGWLWVMTHSAHEIANILLKFNNSLDVEHEIAGGKEINKLMVDSNVEKYGLGYINSQAWPIMAQRLFEAGILKKMPTIQELANAYHWFPSGVFPPQ